MRPHTLHFNQLNNHAYLRQSLFHLEASLNWCIYSNCYCYNRPSFRKRKQNTLSL